MKFIKYSWCSIAVFFLLLSCAKEIGIAPEPEIRYVTLSLDVSMDASIDSTKTYMDGANGQVKWRSSDRVVIYFQYMSFGPITSNPATNIRNDGQTATFTYEIQEEMAPAAKAAIKYIYYGRGDVTCNSSSQIPIRISIPSVQNYAGSDCFADGENVSFGYMASGDTTCTMKNLFGILKVNIKLNDSDKVIDYVQLTDNASGNYLAGEFNLSGLNATPTMSHISGTGGESKSLIKKISGTWTSADSTFYFLVPPGTLNDFNLYVYTKEGYYAGRRIRVSSGTIKRSVVTSVSVKTFGTKPIPYDENCLTANSYIVPAVAGPYSIPAQYMGNGYQGNGGSVAGGSDYEIKGGASAEIVWQGRCNGETILDGEVVSDAIYFTKNGKGYIGFHRSGIEGNALVAVKDASNNILWSWHLWVTSRADSTQISNGKVLVNQQNSSVNVVIIMDRNLGALSADPSDGSQSHGLAYQFGRKDPYMGSRFSVDPTGTITEYASFATIYPALAIYCYDKGPTISLDRSISHPYERSFPSVGNWCSADVYWGDSAGNRATSSPKTLYDPCPAGWRTFEEVYLAQVLGTNTDGTIARPNGEVVTSVDGLAFKLNNNNNPVYFPGSGSSTSTLQVTNVGKNVSIWGSNFFSSGTGATHSQAYFLQINMSKQGTGTDSYTSDTPVVDMSTTMPVRCQRWTEPTVSQVTANTAPSLVRSAECKEEEELEVVYID